MVASSAPASRRPSLVAGPSSLPPPPSPRAPPQPRLRGSSQSRPQPPPLTQPTTVKLNPSALRSLPHRLAHPPAPPLAADGQPCGKTKGKGQARWWSGWTLKIQPEYDVKLEDVLDRKHLPPLGLKDFEEWLVFVEGTPENLYFILWLREYTSRYTSWMSSLRSKQNYRNSPLQPNAATQLAIPSSRNRQFASLGTAISSLSLPPPSPQHSPAASYPPYSMSSPPLSPNPATRTHVDVDSVNEELHRRSTTYRKLYTPSPNPELATFYLRAKETFLTPAAEYELAISSDVLSKFHVPSSSGEKKARRDSGVAFHESRGQRTISSMPERGALGLTGTNMYPPDPAVFDELAEIIQEELRASLKRLVVATYHNVGMPRAYCGSAGGCTIALVTSAPPIIASFAAGGPRWYRLLALPGLWLGMTIFISAMYGVCMMIYVFGDLRQLRSFELARPPPGTADASLKPLKDVSSPSPLSTSMVPPSPSLQTPSKERRASTLLNVRRAFMGKSKSEDRLSPTAVHYSAGAGGELPVRKESLVPVPNPVLLLPTRPRPAHTSNGSGSVRGVSVRSTRSKSRSPPGSLSDVEEHSPREKPKLKLDIWSGHGEEGVVGESGMTHGGEEIQVPPSAVVRYRREEEVGPTVVVSSEDEGALGDESQSDDCDSDDDLDTCDSGFDSGSERESEHHSPWGVNANRSRQRRSRKHRHHEEDACPPIEISDAFYDENPSPEGPATAPADWFPHNLERLAARNPIPDPTSVQSDHPLWPDYSQAQDEYERNAKRNQTASFIAPFVYDGNESGSSCADHTVDAVGSTREGEKDLEKGKARMSADDGVRLAQAAQPIDTFSFEGLPARRPRLHVDTESGGGRVGGLTVMKTMKEEKAEKLREQRRTDPHMKGGVRSRRSPSPGSSVSMSSNGKPQRWYWVLVEWMQVKCGPKNMVDVIEKREKEVEEDKGKAKAGGDLEAGLTPAQIVVSKAQAQAVQCERETSRPSPIRGRENAFVPPSPASAQMTAAVPEVSEPEEQESTGVKSSWRGKLKKLYLSVPAFAAPLTPVLNPLVGRAQWEIVVRSAALSAVLSCVIIGGLLGAPET